MDSSACLGAAQPHPRNSRLSPLVTLAKFRRAAAKFQSRALVAALIAALLGTSTAASSETISYTYDALGRLAKVARSGAVNNGATECYAYDPAGNRSNVTVATSSDCAAAPPPSTTCAGVSFSVSDASAVEGASLVFTVSKTGSTSASCSVNYATADGTALSSPPLQSDYTATSGTLTFSATQTSLSVSVATKADTRVEADETMFLNLSGATTGATISNSQGTGTILDANGGGSNCGQSCI